MCEGEETHRVENVKLLRCVGLVVTPKLQITSAWTSVEQKADVGG
jgi:hypothetical protein